MIKDINIINILTKNCAEMARVCQKAVLRPIEKLSFNIFLVKIILAKYICMKVTTISRYKGCELKSGQITIKY